jgi:predicted ArsR family transcriptional regulator
LDKKEAAAAERILLQLKTRGPLGNRELASALAVSAEAARQQTARLAEAGLVEGRLERSPGAGRPGQRWALTAAGHARFPDAHAQLAVELLDSVRALHGERGIERLVGAREAAGREAYRRALAGARNLGDKVRRLAAARAAEGYMARAERDGRGWLLIEDHCPICAAARACPGFCRAELRLFQELLGEGVRVSREQHLLAGARRCTYRIAAASASLGQANATAKRKAG